MGYQQMNDRDLALAAIKHDEAYGEATRRYYGRIYLTALAFVRQREMAEDIAQEAFLRAWLRRNTVKQSTDTLQPWLVRITRNLAIDWLRTGQQRSRVLPLISIEETTVEPVDQDRLDPRQTAVRAQENRHLTDAVMSLPDDLRQAVLLHYAEGMTPSDIARLNGEAPSTVTRRLDKARELLRQHLESGLSASLAASVQTLRPGSASLQRTLGLITAATTLPAATRAQLLQLAANTPPPPLIDPVTSAASAAQLKGTGIMKSIIAKAGAGKLLAAGAAAVLTVAAGIYALDAVREKSTGAATKSTHGTRAAEITAIASSDISGRARSLPSRNAALNSFSLRSKSSNATTSSEYAASPLQSDAATTAGETIVGTVTVQGGVYDEETSKPLSGAIVRAVAPGKDMRQLKKYEDAKDLPSTITDAAGKYLLQVPLTSDANTVSVDAFHPGYRSVSGTYMSGGDFSKQNIPASAGRIITETLNLPKALYVAGRVVDEHGNPAPKVTAEGTIHFKSSTAYIATVSTDENGIFELFDYPETFHESFGPTKGTITFTSSDYLTTSVPDIYSLVEEQRVDLRVIMSQGSQIRGQLLEASGKPASGIKIHLQYDESHDRERRDDVTDEYGNFNLKGLPEGTATLYARSMELDQRLKTEITIPVSGDLTVSMTPTPKADVSKAVTLLGMKLVDVTPELAEKYDLYIPSGVLILDPGSEIERLELPTNDNQPAEGDQFFMAGDERINNLKEFASEILRVNAKPGSEGIVNEGHKGYVRVRYVINRYRSNSSLTKYLRLTPEDIAELEAFLESTTGTNH